MNSRSLDDALWLGRFRLKCLAKRARSGVLRLLGRDPEAKAAFLCPAAPPRLIWLYWHGGWANAPELVLACRRSWEAANPGWRVIALSRADYGAYADVPFHEDVMAVPRFSEAQFSDLLRLTLLTRHGGVWADATCHCAAPLDGWLPPVMQSGFFAFARPFPDRMLSNWFLAAQPGNPLVARWRDAVVRYWRLTRRLDHYLWTHFLLEDLHRRDRDVRRVWAATPKLSADPAHLAQAHLKGEMDAATLAAALAGGGAPVHKLSWKLDVPSDRLRTTLEMIRSAGALRRPDDAGGAGPSADVA